MTNFGNVLEWRKSQEQGTEFILPSGLHVRIKKGLTVIDLAVQGEGIPMPLVGAAKALAMEGFRPSRFDFEKMREYVEVLNLVVKASLLYPKIGDVPSDDTITIEELTVQERVLIYGEVAQPVGDLARFRQESPDDEDHRSNGKKERKKALQSIGPEG